MRLSHGIVVVALLAIGHTAAHAEVVVFDSFTNRANTALIGNTPRSFIGQAFTTGLPDPLTLSITGIDFAIVSATAQNYTNIVVDVQLWDSSTGAFAGGTDVFSSALPLQTYVYGGHNFANPNTNVVANFNFPAPVLMGGINNLGVTFHVRADTGTGLASTNNLHVAVRGSAGNFAPLVGSTPRNPNRQNNTFYYRNASNKTDFNFLGSDARDLGNGVGTGGQWSMVAMRVRALGSILVPEPSSIVLTGLGALAGLGLLIRRRKA